MSRRSGYRFAAKDMRKCVSLERIPIPQERDALMIPKSGHRFSEKIMLEQGRAA